MQHAGTARPSLTLDCLENFEALNEAAANEEEKDHVIRWTAGVMYAAGGESTYSTIMNFILACLYHPEVLKRAQTEIDTVVGSGRLPTLQDRPQLVRNTFGTGKLTKTSTAIHQCLRQGIFALENGLASVDSETIRRS